MKYNVTYMKDAENSEQALHYRREGRYALIISIEHSYSVPRHKCKYMYNLPFWSDFI